MDAKKIANCVKPVTFINTKAFSLYKNGCLAVGVLVILGTIVFLRYQKNHPNRFYRNNSIIKHCESDEVLLGRVRFYGLIPASSRLTEKYRPSESSEKSPQSGLWR